MKKIFNGLELLSLGVLFVFPFITFSNLKIICDFIFWLGVSFLFVLQCVKIYKSIKIEDNNKRTLDIMAKFSVIIVIGFFAELFVMNKYCDNPNYWWLAFINIFVIILCFCIMGYFIVKPENEKKKLYVKNSIKYISFYYSLDLFGIGIFINNLVITFIFGIISLIMIFYNLSLSFVIIGKKHKLSLLQDFIVGLALTVYLIYIIPDVDLQGVVLTMVSATYGGLLTLVGVAWTIKYNQKQIAEQELLKIKPYFRFVDHSYDENCTSDFSFFPMANIESPKYVKTFILKNSDRSSLTIKDIEYNQIKYVPFFGSDVERGETVRLTLTHTAKEDLVPFIMTVEDIQGNTYKYKVEYPLCEGVILPRLIEIKE